MLELDGFVVSIDTPQPIRVNSGEFCIRGWCIPKKGFENAVIGIKADGAYTPAYMGLPRPDVAHHFKDSKLECCGFVARFPRPVHRKEVSLIARRATEEIVLVGKIAVPSKDAHDSKSRTVLSYGEWLEYKEPELFWKSNEVADRLRALDYKPLISIILPTYNTPEYFLKRCIESVSGQRYPYWQLCIADDCSDADHPILKYLASLSGDERIDVRTRQSRGGISAASNTALELARGEFVVLLDHDDELHPFALVEVVRALNSHEDCHLIYSDEDKINPWGVRSNPAFKPDFDRDMFLSFNYLGHLITLRRDVVSRIGGFRSRCDGAQDWDLLIRATEVIEEDNIRHIRKPLYHWRMHEESTAMNLDAKPYVAKAWATVLEDRCERTAQKARVMEGLFYGSMRLKYPYPNSASLGIVLRPIDGVFQSSIVKACLAGKKANLYDIVGCVLHPTPAEASEIAFSAVAGADGGCTSGSPRSICSLTEMPDDVFVFINGPLETLNHLFFEELAAQAMRKDCGLVTGLSLDARGETIHTGWVRSAKDELLDPFAGIQFPNHAYMGGLSVVRSVEAISPLFFAVRREHLVATGGLGAVSSTHMLHLVKLLTKNASEKGLRVLFTPYAIATFGSPETEPLTEAPDRKLGQAVDLNPNILDFDKPAEFLKSGI